MGAPIMPVPIHATSIFVDPSGWLSSGSNQAARARNASADGYGRLCATLSDRGALTSSGCRRVTRSGPRQECGGLLFDCRAHKEIRVRAAPEPHRVAKNEIPEIIFVE